MVRLRTIGIDAMFSLCRGNEEEMNGMVQTQVSCMSLLLPVINSDCVVVCVVARIHLRWDAVQCSHMLGFSSHIFPPGRGFFPGYTGHIP